MFLKYFETHSDSFNYLYSILVIVYVKRSYLIIILKVNNYSPTYIALKSSSNNLFVQFPQNKFNLLKFKHAITCSFIGKIKIPNPIMYAKYDLFI